MEITVIDDDSYAGWFAGLTRTDEVYMSNAQSMVINVLGKAGANKISRLNILDHGNTLDMELGDDVVTAANVDTFSTTLGLLRGHFTPTGFVHLQHCNIGSNRCLLRKLAQIWGVSVYAGTGKQNTVYRFNTGSYVRCDTNGLYYVNVGRP